MKRLLLIFAIIAICIGFCSAVMASPTLPDTGSTQPESPSYYEVKKDSEFFLLEWLYWLLDDVLGIKDRDKDKRYYPVESGSSYDSGDSGSGYDSGDYDWDYDPGDGGSGSDPGDGGSGSDSGDGGSGSDSGDGGWGTDPGSDGGSGSGSGNTGWEPYTGSGSGGWGTGGGANPSQTIPAPGALILCGIGSGIVSWLRRRRTL